MSKNNYTDSPRLRRLFLLILLFGVFSEGVSAEVFHTYVASGERVCVEADVPSAGTLLVEALVAPSADVEPRLDLVGAACSGKACKDAARGFRWLERRAAGGVVGVREAGSYRVCLRAQDRDERLGDVKLVTGFAGQVLLKDGDPNEDEPDPDPVTAAGADLPEICRGLRGDDYADALACAEHLTLGVEVAGAFSDVWGDDDVFYFVVPELATVRLEVRGDAGLEALLADRHGNVLRTGEGDKVRLVKTLVPGRYFVRLRGATGSYRLTKSLEP